MTYTFKLARRIARFRAPLCATLIAILNGCDGARSLAPDQSGPAGHDPAAADPIASASFAGGIPIGLFAQPTSAFGSRYNGAHRNISPHLLLEELETIKARGGKVVLALSGSPNYYLENGHFSFSKWKARVDRYKEINFSRYIEDGTVIGHYMIDEPNDPANWNGRPVPPSMLDELGRYSKQLWPEMPTIVRVEPNYLDRGQRYVDVAWAQYLNRKGDAEDFIRRNVAEAQDRGVALIVGLNVIHGGSPNGTPMNASEVESWGSTLLSSSYPCAFISWQYDQGQLSSGSMQDAMDALRRQAENRSTRACRGTDAGGGPVPPGPIPPRPPPPPPDPSPGEGVPFGPHGLPTSAMSSFSGSVRDVAPNDVIETVTAARAAGARVILRLTDNAANRDGTFSLTRWKAALDRYAGVNLSSFVEDGTIAGHLLVQGPHNPKAWGGRLISHATLEEMARYSRQRWPGLPTIVHAPPSWLGTRAWEYLDAASVTYAASAGNAETWIDEQASAAVEARLGLLVGLNVLNGGTPGSGLRGTVRGKYAMSATQVRNWGTILVTRRRVCGLMLAWYDEDYFRRSDVREALGTLGETAQTRPSASCRVR